MWLSPPRVDDLQEGDPEWVGAYRLVGRLGKGGMGTVYLAETDEGTRVAVKVVTPELAADPGFRERFRREVRAASRVARFCTAQVLDADLDGSLLFMVTEYVQGPTLKQLVEQVGPISGSALEGLAVGVANALSTIHESGLVHRDLKPGNVLLSAVGPRVIDFGIAKAMDSVSRPTLTGQTIGTPSYMAPEQATGKRATAATDVFAWGGLITYAGTGRPPFGEGPVATVLYRVAHQEPELGGLEGRLRQLVTWALTKEPEGRPSAQALLDSLLGRSEVSRSAAASAAQRTWAASGPAATTPTGQGAPASLAPSPTARLPETAEPVEPSGGGPAGDPTEASTPNRPRRLRATILLFAAVLALVGTVSAWRLGMRQEAGGEPPTTTAATTTAPTTTAATTTTLDSSLIFQSDFTDRESWPSDFRAKVQDGRLRLRWSRTKDGPTVELQVPADVPENVLIRVRAKAPAGGRDTDYGVWCYGEDYGSQYKLQVDPDNLGVIEKVTFGPDGHRRFLKIQGATQPKIGKRSEHELVARCQRQQGGVRLRLWVDGRLVAQAFDTTNPLRPGSAGIYAGLDADRGPNADVSFDDFAMYHIGPND
jgi:serine/threonine protein kinase